MQITTSMLTAFLAVVGVTNARVISNRTPGPSCAAKGVITLPTTGVAPELPDVSSGLVLKNIALGYGYQNYTCTAPNTTSTAIGALAVLYDALPLYPNQSPFSLSSTDAFYSLTGAALKTTIPLNIAAVSSESTSSRVALAAPAVQVSSPFPSTPIFLDLSAAGASVPLVPIGQHFFDSKGVPNFLLGPEEHLIAAKKSSHAAPNGASTGPNGEPAIPWLYLADAGGSVGITAVYRVETAAGSGHICDKAGADSSVYAAFYFFYGPPSA